MKIDFRPSDLLDRADWDDPDFPAFARVLESLSHKIEIKQGEETVRSHVISVMGSPSKDSRINRMGGILNCKDHSNQIQRCFVCDEVFKIEKLEQK